MFHRMTRRATQLTASDLWTRTRYGTGSSRSHLPEQLTAQLSRSLTAPLTAPLRPLSQPPHGPLTGRLRGIRDEGHLFVNQECGADRPSPTPRIRLLPEMDGRPFMGGCGGEWLWLRAKAACICERAVKRNSLERCRDGVVLVLSLEQLQKTMSIILSGKPLRPAQEWRLASTRDSCVSRLPNSILRRSSAGSMSLPAWHLAARSHLLLSQCQEMPSRPQLGRQASSYA